MAEKSQVGCLGTAQYHCASSGVICGQVWLLSADSAVLGRYPCSDEVPDLFSAEAFHEPLGLIRDCGFDDAFYRIEPALLGGVLQAIQSARPAELYAINREFLPFYCPDCRCCFDASLWSCVPVFDDGFYDFTEATCPNGHRQDILD